MRISLLGFFKKILIKMADITINRPAYGQAMFDEIFQKANTHQRTLLERIKYCSKNYCSCSGDCLKEKVLTVFPFINIMQNYKWKKWIFSDILSGLCVGVIHIPLSMGFAILSSLPPVYGLYSTLFPLVLYFFFGTSKHISVGAMGIISIMMGAIVERETEKFLSSRQVDSDYATTIWPEITSLPFTFHNITLHKMVTIANDEIIKFKLGIVMSLSCLVGFSHLLMSILRLGVVANFMSTSFISGFVSGAGFHLFTSQIPVCLGIKVPKQIGIFRVPKVWYWIFKTIPQTVTSEIIISVISIIILVILKEVINKKFKHKLKVPIPAELIVFVSAIIISHFGKLHDNFNVRILEDIPKGIPPPKVPSFHNASTYIMDSFVIALVVFVINMSLAKLFSHKYGYPIDTNQELLAYGIMHTVGSFFNSFAGAQSPPRTFVHEQTRGKTQVAGLVSAILMLLTCLVLAPLCEPLPNSVLGAIIIVALIPSFKQFKSLPQFWSLSKHDFFVWLISFLSAVILDIDIGIAIGMGISILCVILETHLASGKVLGNAKRTELYLPLKHYKNLYDHSSEGFYVFKFESLLYFANAENFQKELFSKVLNPSAFKKRDEITNVPVIETAEQQITPKKESLSEVSIVHENHIGNGITIKDDKNISGKRISHFKAVPTLVILDCSAIVYIDLSGLNMMKFIRDVYKDVGVRVVLANCPEKLLQKLVKHGIDAEDVFPSVQDAIAIFTTKSYQEDQESTHF